MTLTGLLERCMDNTCLPEDISHLTPSLRKRMKVLSSTAKRPLFSSTFTGHSRRGVSSADYCPLIKEPADVQPLKPMARNCLSFSIPGAMSVDPYVRQLAQVAGMKVSENAIWLLVIALREHALSVLKSAVVCRKSLEAGSVPPPPLLRPFVPSSKNKDAFGSPKSAGDKEKNKNSSSVHQQIIRPEDILMLTSGMSIGSARSVGGSVSRPAFERTLFALSSTSVPPGGAVFSQVHQFFTSKIIPSQSQQSKASPRSSLAAGTKLNEPSRKAETAQATTSMPAAQARSRSPHTGGLGRGAKDLAALKARTSITARNNPTPPVQTLEEKSPDVIPHLNKQQPLAQEPAFDPPKVPEATVATTPGSTSDSAIVLVATTAPAATSATASPSAAASATAEPPPPPAALVTTAPSPLLPPPPAASSETQALAPAAPPIVVVPTRRGKGFGIKNLAAMRARAVHKPDEDENKPEGKEDQAAAGEEKSHS